jgi:hypothetical protein
LYPINAYFLVGLALLLLIIGYAYKRYILLLFSGTLFIIFGFSLFATNLLSQVGEYVVANTSQVNVTLSNSTFLYQNTTGITEYVYGIIFILLGFYLLFDGAYGLAKFGEA